MRRIVCNSLLGLALATLIAGSPAGALAVGYEDSLDDCNYPPVFDLAVMRPLSFSTMVVGTVLYVPLFPIAAVTVPRDLGKVGRILVGAPARFTFGRRLGECTGVELVY